MTYRDETTALAEKNQSLEREIAEKNREIVLLRDEAAAQKSHAPARAVALDQQRSSRLRASLAVAIIASVVLGAAVIASMTGAVRPPFDVVFPALGATGTVLFLSAFALLLNGVYVVVPPGLALVSWQGPREIVTRAGDGRLLFPLMLWSWIDTAPRVARRTIDVRCRDDKRTSIELTARYAVPQTNESIVRALHRWANATNAERDELVCDRLDSAAREIFARVSSADIDDRRSEIEDRLREHTQSSMADAGLELLDVSFTAR